VSRPRRPYGNPPGRLPATMIRVLAAEMSDSGRLSRGKRYWADHAVVDIVVGHGAVTAEIQGSRSQPYVVTIETRAGNGVPSKRDLWVRCTCPDDAGTGRDACKHAVAALFALSDEIAVEPELLDRWRGGLGGAHHDHRGTLDDEPDDDDVDDGSTRTASAWPSNVVPLRPGLDRGFGARVPSRPPPEPEPEPDPTADEIATLLAAPAGARAPVFPVVEPLVHPPLRDHLLDEVLTDAISQLGLNLD
jgi:hypothetical protein